MAQISIQDAFEVIYIDESQKDSELALRALQFFAPDKIQYINDEPLSHIKGELSGGEFSQSKRRLHITSFKGQFFKRCPGARPGLTCCNYFVLNLGSQCHMNCSYCYLQSFINTPVSKMYTNIEQALTELSDIRSSCKDLSLRIGTGEVIDSLALDPMALYSHKLIDFFNSVPNWRLEFKTKTNFVDQFLNVPHAKNVIVSWSVNPEHIIEREEHGTSSLTERLDAAVKVRQKDFIVSFHIDPMIWHPDWKSNYKELIDQICNRFSPVDVPVMSVGALRFQPEQRHIMRDRFGSNSYVTQAEVFKSSDGKLRYDKNLRSEMFQFVVNEFKSRNSKWNVFLCMESPESWLGSVKSLPTKDEALRSLFDHRPIQKFNEMSAGN